MRLAFLLCITVLMPAPVRAAQAATQPAGTPMPDPRQMSGVPLPSSDLAVGTLTVRVIRGALSNPLAGEQVQLTGGVSRAGTTNESGRAEFSDLTPGTRLTAVAIVNGEKLESQEIQIPSSGGIRLMLVATDPEAAKRAEEDRRLAQGPAQRGIVVLGDQSRFVFELGDQGINVFNILQILNTARVPIEPATPIVFGLPDGAEHSALLEGSSPLAVAATGRVQVNGPLPPGVTLVQFAYTLPYSGARATVRQVLPAQLARLTVIAQKVGELRLDSDQIAQQREMTAEGQTYILGQGPAVVAGGAVEVRFSGLPHAATWPRNTALTLVVLILVGGAAISLRGRRSSTGTDREQLTATRNRLFDELTALEESHRDGRIAPAAYGSRRQRLVASLERVYSELDEDAAVSGL